jgi:serine phosphatase RsbU (regulator of sigma subunit)
VLFANLAEINLLPGFFIQEDPAFFICLCLLIYVAIHRNNASENELLMVKRDLETAHKIQAAIIPRHVPSPGGLGISARYVPMTQVGGDFYDFHLVDDHHLGILVADVSGHGIPAALIASMVKIAFLSELSNADRPEALLQGMNNTLTGQLDNEFITVIYLYIDLETRRITFSTAGHPTPIVLSKGQSHDTFLCSGSIPLGIRTDVSFPCRNMDLSVGDRVIIYTDGLTESAGHRGELFGTARLSKHLRESLELPVEQAADHILSTVMKWSGRKKGASLDDDLTFILFDAGW